MALKLMSADTPPPNTDRQLIKPAHNRRGVYLLPNLLTTGALFCGFYSIIAAINDKFVIAAIAIFIAMILDGLDGRVARMVNAQSEFGAEYDSLSDMISFGLAPSLLMYEWSLVFMYDTSPILGKIGWMAAFIYVACAAMRLARFNVQSDSLDKRFFIGLPSPSAAAVVASTVWVLQDTGYQGEELQIIALVVIVSAGLLMVSNVRYHSFKDFDIKNKVPHTAVLIMILVFALIAIDPPKILFIVFLTFTVSGPLLWAKRRLTKKN